MSDNIDKINLHAEAHAIEVVNFVVNFSLPIDHADIRRFADKEGDFKELFPAISTPQVYEINLASPMEKMRQPSPVPIKELTYFASDGRPEWVAAFGDNRVSVSSRRYTKWDEIWPSAKKRLDALLSCVDTYKPVHSIDFSVTDTFSAKTEHKALVPSNVFSANKYLPQILLESTDPRWDFNQGWFEDAASINQVLVRIEGRGGIQNDRVIASISNSFSQRFGKSQAISDIKGEAEINLDQTFINFHDKNKRLLRDLLVDQLLIRMNLKGD